jgi:hypothetical protein
MSNGRTWDVLSWPDKPESVRRVFLTCPKCGTDAAVDMGETPGGLMIAAIGLGIVFDPPGYIPPDNFMPPELRCRHCRRIFTSKGG